MTTPGDLVLFDVDLTISDLRAAAPDPAHAVKIACRRFWNSTRALAAPVLLLLCGPLAAAAQVRGQVVDAGDNPVADAVVELWVGSSRVAITGTDPEGRFELGGGTPAADQQLMLTARRVGLATRTVPLASLDTTLVVRLGIAPVVLAPLTVTSVEDAICPTREDPRARDAWERMRRLYWQAEDDSVFVFGFLESRSETGERVDAFDPAAGQTSTGWTSGSLVYAHPEYMSLTGYATSAAGGAGERTAFWSYRALDAGMMQDFTGDYFGAAHDLTVLSQGPERTVIAFCPKDRLRRTGQIEGTLELRPDGSLRLARWRFRTPRPGEDAGGEASYLEPDPRLGRALLADETVFWRRSTFGRYYFEAKSFTDWRRWHRANGGEEGLPP